MKGGAPPQPPRWADRLLRRVIPDRAEADTILGDLHQELDEQRDARSGWVLRWLYATRALGIALHYAWFRVRGGTGPRGRARDDTHGWRGGETLGSLWGDVRYAFRTLRRTPLLTVAGVLTIALGVGLTTHAFSSVYGSMIRRPSVDPDGRLLYVHQTRLDRGVRRTAVPIHDLQRLRERTTLFEELAGYYQTTLNLADDAGPPERLTGLIGTDDLLRLSGIAPVLGRVHADGEEGPGSPRLAVLGHDVWRTRFAADPGVLGRSIRLNGVTYEVIGVMPERFGFPFNEDIWVTHEVDEAEVPPRSGRSFEVLARPRAGVSREAALEELRAVNARTVEEFGETHEGVGIDVGGYVDRYMPDEIQNLLWLMMAAVVGVLLVASANVANLLLARSMARGREVAVRSALGASRARVLRQLLVESAILGLAGGAAGLAVAHVGIVLFNNALVDIPKPYWIDIRLDGAVLAFALVVTLGAALVAGTVPALKASGVAVGPVLRDESRGSTSLRLGRFSAALVVGELAVSCALLVGAGLMIRSIVNLDSRGLGFEGEDVMTAMIVVQGDEYAEPEQLDAFWGELHEHLAAVPGARSAALSAFSPGTGAYGMPIATEGQEGLDPSERPRTNANSVSEGFFEVYGIPILQGRGFEPSEWRLEGDPVAVVSESFVRRFHPDGDVIGRRIKVGRDEAGIPWLTVVGVAADAFAGSGDVGGLGAERNGTDMVYTAFMTHRPRGGVLAMKASGDPAPLAAEARAIVQELDRDLPLFNVGTAEEALRFVNWAFPVFGSLFSVFGLCALLLAAVGLYGVMAFSVERRRHEMGVRMALGAQRGRIVRLVMRRGMLQLLVGAGAGLLLGALLSQGLRSALLGVEPSDPVVYAAIAFTLGATGVAATLVPALRATRVDPSRALRPD